MFLRVGSNLVEYDSGRDFPLWKRTRILLFLHRRGPTSRLQKVSLVLVLWRERETRPDGSGHQWACCAGADLGSSNAHDQQHLLAGQVD